MSETRVFADGYRGVFQNQEDFLDCLKSIGRNSFWERKTSKNLRLVAITSGSRVEKELKEKYADEGLDEGIITDTILSAGACAETGCSLQRGRELAWYDAGDV